MVIREVAPLLLLLLLRRGSFMCLCHQAIQFGHAVDVFDQLVTAEAGVVLYSLLQLFSLGSPGKHQLLQGHKHQIRGQWPTTDWLERKISDTAASKPLHSSVPGSCMPCMCFCAFMTYAQYTQTHCLCGAVASRFSC